MRTIFIIALAAIAATPALAGSGSRKKLRVYHQGHHQYHPYWRHSHNSWNVYAPGVGVVGRDPDPRVRQHIRDEEMRFRNQAVY